MPSFHGCFTHQMRPRTQTEVPAGRQWRTERPWTVVTGESIHKSDSSFFPNMQRLPLQGLEDVALEPSGPREHSASEKGTAHPDSHLPGGGRAMPTESSGLGFVSKTEATGSWAGITSHS